MLSPMYKNVRVSFKIDSSRMISYSMLEFYNINVLKRQVTCSGMLEFYDINILECKVKCSGMLEFYNISILEC